MSIETSFFSSKAPKERKVCIAKRHRGWNGPRAERFAPSDPEECHRRVLAAFIKENINLDVPEWNGRRHDGQFSLLP